jgi:hypothetical protein
VDVGDSLSGTTNGISNYTRDKAVLLFSAQSMLYTCNDSGCIIINSGLGNWFVRQLCSDALQISCRLCKRPIPMRRITALRPPQ